MVLLAVGIGLCILINLGVLLIGGRDISQPEDVGNLKNADCILVLGCQVKDDGSPSHMLQDRLERAIALYNNPGIRTNLLMSGDHGQQDYNEVATMRQYALDRGVPSQDIFMDHAGFSTYESIYRAKYIFGAQRIIIVTQKYHLYRALYIAWALGLDAEGVSADYRSYYGQLGRELREVLARVKDFGMCLLRAKPTYLGEAIDLTGSGEVTNITQDKSAKGKQNIFFAYRIGSFSICHISV